MVVLLCQYWSSTSFQDPCRQLQSLLRQWQHCWYNRGMLHCSWLGDFSLIDEQVVLPPGTPTYNNRLSFIKAQPTAQFVTSSFGVVPAPDPYIILDVFHSCDKIALHWLLPESDDTGLNVVDIRGIDLIHTQEIGCEWQITTVFSEWNNLLWIGSQGECATWCVPLEPVIAWSLLKRRKVEYFISKDAWIRLQGELAVVSGNNTHMDED
jgi:hypothetical protein